MFPACFEAVTFLGAVPDRARNRPQFRLGQPDFHVDHAALAIRGRFRLDGRDGDRRHQPGSNDRTTQIEFEIALVDVARFEPRYCLKVLA